MKNTILLMVALMLSSISASYARVEQVYSSSSSGTTSATVFIPRGTGLAEVRDLAWRLDAAVTTGFIGEYIGSTKYIINSATSANASVLWFANTNTAIGAGEFLIFLDESAGTYYLRRTSAATTTSVTLVSSINITTTTSDMLWSTLATVEKPVSNATSGSFTNPPSGGATSLWFPNDAPTALVIDGNTTSCRISIHGIRSSN